MVVLEQERHLFHVWCRKRLVYHQLWSWICQSNSSRNRNCKCCACSSSRGVVVVGESWQAAAEIPIQQSSTFSQKWLIVWRLFFNHWNKPWTTMSLEPSCCWVVLWRFRVGCIRQKRPFFIPWYCGILSRTNTPRVHGCKTQNSNPEILKINLLKLHASRLCYKGGNGRDSCAIIMVLVVCVSRYVGAKWCHAATYGSRDVDFLHKTFFCEASLIFDSLGGPCRARVTMTGAEAKSSAFSEKRCSVR